jgi:hypothetical protein
MPGNWALEVLIPHSPFPIPENSIPSWMEFFIRGDVSSDEKID